METDTPLGTGTLAGIASVQVMVVSAMEQCGEEAVDQEAREAVQSVHRCIRAAPDIPYT